MYIDALSHLTRSITTSLNCIPGDLVHLINHLSTTAISSDKIKEWTKRDPILLKVYCCISMGWPNTVDESHRPYQTQQDELNILDGCILQCSHVIIPPPGRQSVLKELHDDDTHLGCEVTCLQLYLAPKNECRYWNHSKSYIVYQENRPSPPSAPLHSRSGQSSLGVNYISTLQDHI